MSQSHRDIALAHRKHRLHTIFLADRPMLFACSCRELWGYIERDTASESLDQVISLAQELTTREPVSFDDHQKEHADLTAWVSQVASR